MTLRCWAVRSMTPTARTCGADVMGYPDINIRKAVPELATCRFIFVLIPGFSSLDLGAGLESLAAANAAEQSHVFEWEIVSETGTTVESSSGMTVAVDSPLPATSKGDCIVICGPRESQQVVSTLLNAWLRKAKRFGATLCGVGGGALILVKAGLAEGHRLSTHWKLEHTIAELYADIDPICSVFEECGSIVTCAGGATTLDLFSALIARNTAAHTTSQVADDLLCGTIRSASDRQTRSDQCRVGTRHEKLSKAIRFIEDNLEDDLSPSIVAEQVGLSTRQLERLFLRYLDASPKAYITALRLDRARNMLQQTQMRVIDVALACGFKSSSNFSKLYRKQFSSSPHIEKGTV